MKKKVYGVKNKNYLISQDGIIFQEDGTITEDVQVINNHYYLVNKPVHRIVYQLFKGKIPKGFCVHHINTCPRDNRISNLILMTNSEHSKLHGDIENHPQFKQQLKSKAIVSYYGKYNAKGYLIKTLPTVVIREVDENTSTFKFSPKDLRIMQAFNQQIEKLNRKNSYRKKTRYILE